MKKILYVISLVALLPMLSGCHKEYEFEMKKKPTTGNTNGHEWVDLGLSVKWATCNIGANAPQNYGEYIAWGDIYDKSSYNTDNCDTYGKIYSSLPSSMDAARKRWGGSWRMPTRSEVFELVNTCSYKWKKKSGVYGYEFTGPNGNSIFIPAGGVKRGSTTYEEGVSGYLWTKTACQETGEWEDCRSFMLYYNSEDGTAPTDSWVTGRFNGLNIRPVLD